MDTIIEFDKKQIERKESFQVLYTTLYNNVVYQPRYTRFFIPESLGISSRFVNYYLHVYDSRQYFCIVGDASSQSGYRVSYHKKKKGGNSIFSVDCKKFNTLVKSIEFPDQMLPANIPLKSIDNTGREYSALTIFFSEVFNGEWQNRNRLGIMIDYLNPIRIIKDLKSTRKDIDHD